MLGQTPRPGYSATMVQLYYTVVTTAFLGAGAGDRFGGGGDGVGVEHGLTMRVHVS